MAEVILTAERLTYTEAKRVSKDLIGEFAPNFVLNDDAGNVFDSESLNGSWRILFFYAKKRFSNMQARLLNVQRTTRFVCLSRMQSNRNW